MTTFYDMLGVPQDAPSERIRARFNELRANGTLEPGSDAFSRMVKIVEILVDPRKRELYDQRAGLAGNPAIPGHQPTPSTALRAQERLDSGREALAQAHWDEAARCLKEAIGMLGEHAQAHGLYGYALYRTGQVETALAEYRVAISLDSRCAPAYRGLGIYFADLDRPDDALRELQHAQALDPQDIETLQALADLAEKRGEIDQAIELFRAAKVHASDHPAPHRRLGDLYIGHGRFEEAAQEYAKLVELRPWDADAYERMGRAHFKLEAWDRAEACFKMAIQAKGDHVEAHVGLGRLLAQLGRPDAQAILEKLVKLAPENADGQWLLGRHHLKLGQYDEAESLLKNALRLHPRHRYAHVHMGELLLYLDRAEEAVRELELHLEADSMSEKGRLLLGEALERTGRLEEAEQAYRFVLVHHPGNPSALFQLGNALVRSGDYDAAIKTLMQAHEAVPDIPETLFRLAEAFAASGRLREAAARYRRGLDLAPGDREAQFGLASVLVTSEQYPEAVGILQRLCQTDRDDARAHAELAAALAGSGVYDEAIAHLGRAIELAPAWPQPYHRLTDLHEKLEAWEDARTVMNRYSTVFPQDPVGFYRLGRAYRSEGFDSEAGAAFRKYLRMAPQGEFAEEIMEWLEAQA